MTYYFSLLVLYIVIILILIKCIFLNLQIKRIRNSILIYIQMSEVLIEYSNIKNRNNIEIPYIEKRLQVFNDVVNYDNCFDYKKIKYTYIGIKEIASINQDSSLNMKSILEDINIIKKYNLQGFNRKINSIYKKILTTYFPIQYLVNEFRSKIEIAHLIILLFIKNNLAKAKELFEINKSKIYKTNEFCGSDLLYS